MTPEEYVRTWWALYRLGECSTDYVLMRAADLLRVALAEEREACAAVAERHGREVHVVPQGILDDAKMIAAAIRARTTSAPSPPSP